MIPTPSLNTKLLALLAASTIAVYTPVQAAVVTSSDSFGTGANTFNIDFVAVGDTGNANDTTGYGAVGYNYRIGTYEISQNQIDKATANGLVGVSSGPWTGDQPATNITWFQMAAFVNWLNTSTGNQAAYNLSWDGSTWSMSLWDSADAWQTDGENLFRHKDSRYFLPSTDEWYKAAYYNPAASTYFDYPTASNSAPTSVSGGTAPNTAVWGSYSSPADIDNAGGLSPYGTMAQGANVWDILESASDGTNDSTSENRVRRGGNFGLNSVNRLLSTYTTSVAPTGILNAYGFRVASASATAAVPEPGQVAASLLLLAGIGGYAWTKHRKAAKKTTA